MSSISTDRIARFAALSCLLFTILAVLPSVPYAQEGGTGMLTGECVDAATGAPMPGVTVHAVLKRDTSIGHYTFTNGQGKYRFRSLQPGEYWLSSSILGYTPSTRPVTVVSESTVTENFSLSAEALHSQDVVVTASRRPEKVIDAPASVSIVTPVTIQEHISATPTDILATVPGIDLSREGIASATYATRSMHSVYGSDVLTMNDYHSTELPAIGGFYGILMPQSPDDIDHVEIVRGPGSAMYGPDAATGVIHFITRSPFASQGTSASVAGGERGYFDGTIRHAQAFGDNFAIKVSGHYLRANDWSLAYNSRQDSATRQAQRIIVDPNTTQSVKDSLSKIGKADSSLEVYWLEARADAIFSDHLTGGVTAGLTRILNEVAMTEDFGAAQIQNWQYTFLQAHLNYDDLFIQGAINHDDTKSSYDIVTGGPIADRSTTYNLQIQHRWDPTDYEKLTYGADYNAIVPKTDSTLYGPDDGHSNTQILGAYIQSQTSFADRTFELTLAGRIDKHSYLTTPIFSPRAALVYHISEEHLVRAMYNETYLFPTITGLYADLLYRRDAFGFGDLGLTKAGISPVDIRYTSPYVAGMHFVTVNGEYSMNTTLTHGTPIPSSLPASQAVNIMWPVLMGLATADTALKAVAGAIRSIPAPSSSQVATYLAYLNLNSKKKDHSDAFLPISGGIPLDISDVKPQHQRTLELDYQGSISKSVQFEIDGYQTHYTSVRASTVALSPNVLANFVSLRQYLIDSLTTRVGALAATFLGDTLAKIMAGLPLGVVQPTGGSPNEMHPTDVLVGTRSYLDNSIEFYGVDAMAEIKPNDDWSFSISGSWLNKNYWYPSELLPGTDSIQQNAFALNIAKYRASISARYSGLTKGLSIELRDRWHDGFLMNDSYWVGDIQASHVLDLTVNYRIPSFNDLLLTLSVSNLLNNYHQELVGAPYIGRLALLRASYTLPSL